MEIKQLTYRIEGLTPLLMHNPQGMMLNPSASTPSKTKRLPSHEEEAELGAYRTAEGFLAMPSIAIRNCTITAAGAFKHKTRSWKSFVSHIQIEPADLMPLFDVDSKPITDYEI